MQPRQGVPLRCPGCWQFDGAELQLGDLVVFEYHRTPRHDREIVIANFPEFGPGETGTEAIKRITQDAVYWIFQSDNADYKPIRVPKIEITHPILGTMVEILK